MWRYLKMEELQISIDVLKERKQNIEVKVDDFNRYGRSPNDSDYEQIIQFLDEWDKIRYKIEILQQCLDAVISNAT